MTRQVKLGRKPLLPPLAYHWAVKVGDTWHEITIVGGKKTGKSTKVNSNSGDEASSGAGSLGGELAGETSKTDMQIDKWIEDWSDTNEEYDLTSTNCQKFAWEFMDWLTDGNFICPHNFDASDCDGGVATDGFMTFARAEEGNAIARVSYGGKTERFSKGVFNAGLTAMEAKGQAVAGPGFGAWGDASLIRVEGSIGGVVGAHLDANVNTGVGVRNGNLDAHLLGLGFKIGADGISLDTPLGGITACSIM